MWQHGSAGVRYCCVPTLRSFYSNSSTCIYNIQQYMLAIELVGCLNGSINHSVAVYLGRGRLSSWYLDLARYVSRKYNPRRFNSADTNHCTLLQHHSFRSAINLRLNSHDKSLPIFATTYSSQHNLKYGNAFSATTNNQAENAYLFTIDTRTTLRNLISRKCNALSALSSCV